jgi:hypothetical protein
VNDPGCLPIETADRTIRNQRYHIWPALAFHLGLAAVLITGGYVLVRYANSTTWSWIYLAVGLVTYIALTCLGLHVPLLTPVWRLKLGESLQVFGIGPGIWPPERIERIDFRPDPAEDYVEQKLPVPMVEVRLAMRYRVRRRLIVSGPDAARLREWAVSKVIVVNDPGGHSFPRSAE